MNVFLKIFKKQKIRKNSCSKVCPNPPKKNLIKPKPLLIKNSNNFSQRNFGKEIQNLRHLTEENHCLINNKKRNRKKINPVSKFTKNDKHINKNNIHKISQNTNKEKNKVFNIIHLSNNKVNQNNYSCISIIEEEEIRNENINPNINKDLNSEKEISNIGFNNENKNKIKKINEQLIINKKDNLNDNDIKEIKVIKKNSIKNTCEKEKEDKINVEKTCQEQLKKIKVCIIGNKHSSPRKHLINLNKSLELQNAKEYLEEIYLHLKSVEKKNLPLENYMSIKQSDINEKMRTILINWIIEVHFKFHLLSETLFICINLIDRYLSKKDINRKYLQLLGVTSLFIACKYEEIYSPSSKDLIFMTDNAYKIEEMVQMESDILNIIEFDLTYPTSLRFLEIYRHFLDLDEINFYRCSYLNEICLINYNLCSFNPSLIACVCLYLNLKSNILYFKGYNEEQLFRITGYKKNEIDNCLNILLGAVTKIEEPDNKFNAVKKKYSLEKFMKVSNDSFLIKVKNEDMSKGFVSNVNLFENKVIV